VASKETSIGVTKGKTLSLIAIFAALGVVCDAILMPGFSAGVWFGGIFMFSSIAGIVLGPYNGFISTFIAVMIGHSLVPRDTIYELIFTLGAPTGSMISGFMFSGDWKKVLAFYTIILVSYFATPISWHLPAWGMWDIYVAYLFLLALSVVMRVWGLDKIRYTSLFAVSTFIGLEGDVLLRIFILVPCKGYQFFYGLTPEALVAIWAVPAPIITPIKVLLATLTTTMITPRIIRVFKNTKTWQ